MRRLKNIDLCEHPKRIVNPYTKELMYVECRKCPSCLNRRSSEWHMRLASETKKHRYSMFLTLTYDNEHLPVFTPELSDADGNTVWLPNRDCDFENGLLLSDDVEKGFIVRPIPIEKSDIIGVNYVCKSDCVKFLKRLRYYIHQLFKSNNIKENEKIRYFLCSEYGPRTLRPHYHAIIWFDSESICSNFGNLLSKAWPFGITDFSLVNSGAPHYVAKYLNGNTRYPEVLRAEHTHTFHLSSKNPLIGYDTVDEEQAFECLNNGTYGSYQLDHKSLELLFVPTPRQVESRYLPKCRGFGRISRFEKLRVYSYEYDAERKGCPSEDIDLKSVFDSATDIHATKACNYFCKKFNLTPEIYLMRLEEYYHNKERFKLAMQYSYQEQYVDELHEPLYHLIGQDPTIYEQLPGNVWKFRNSHISEICRSFGITSGMLYDRHGYLDGFKVDRLKQHHSQFYRNNVNEIHDKLDKSNKLKEYNEMADPFIFMSDLNI